MTGGYVLAGGRSSRMGTDKALLRRGPETMLLRSARVVAEACGSAVIVGDPARYRSSSYSVIPDRFPGKGPLAGIHAALLHSIFDWNLIVACDMPALETPKLIRLLSLIPEHPDADAIVPRTGDLAQPLCALYRRSALPAIERALERNTLRIAEALRFLRVAAVASESPEMFRNINTPEDWNALLDGAPAQT